MHARRLLDVLRCCRLREWSGHGCSCCDVSCGRLGLGAAAAAVAVDVKAERGDGTRTAPWLDERAIGAAAVMLEAVGSALTRPRPGDGVGDASRESEAVGEGAALENGRTGGVVMTSALWPSVRTCATDTAAAAAAAG